MRAIGDGSSSRAWDLTVACARQGKWRDLRRLLAYQQLGQMPKAEATLLVARVIASGGSEFTIDLDWARERGYPIFALSDAVGMRNRPGTMIIFRAKVQDEVVGEGGVRTLELAEEQRRTNDVNLYAVFSGGGGIAVANLGRAGSEDFYQASGVTVVGLAARDLPAVGPDRSYVFIAQVEKVTATEQVRARILAISKPGISGP
ncbi:MAG: hypothetical protein IT384_13875 [Deltaproteobacteria bacterium]|nr:hypothetical protein [Deltaproteobacteria bacterium]